MNISKILWFGLFLCLFSGFLEPENYNHSICPLYRACLFIPNWCFLSVDHDVLLYIHPFVLPPIFFLRAFSLCVPADVCLSGCPSTKPFCTLYFDLPVFCCHLVGGQGVGFYHFVFLCLLKYKLALPRGSQMSAL